MDGVERQVSGCGLNGRGRQVVGQVLQEVLDRQAGGLGHLLDLIAAEGVANLVGADRQVVAIAPRLTCVLEIGPVFLDPADQILLDQLDVLV